MDVTLLYFDGCPGWSTLDRRLRALSGEFGYEVTHERIETAEAAEQAHFIGSPTVLVDGRDPFARGDEPPGLACRLYETPAGLAGSPTLDQLRAVLAAPSG